MEEEDKVLGTQLETVFRYKKKTDSRAWEDGRGCVAQWVEFLCGLMR